MKLLLDQNLSRMLVRRLSNEYPESVHVAEVGLETAADRDIWEYAGEQGYVIVSKDSGSRSSVIRCSSPRLVLVRCSGCRSTRSARSSSNASQPIQRRAAGCSARKFAVCSTLASCRWELQDRVSGRWLSGRPGGEGGALSTGGAKRCPKALPGSTAKWSGPNVTVKFSMNPICPRMIEVPWCGHGSSTPASPCHDRRESMTPKGGIASKASSNSRASNARPPSRDRELLSRGICRVSRRSDHFFGDDGQRTAGIDQRGERRPPARNCDAQCRPKHRSTECSVRLTEVGVAKDPRVSQDRTRQARRAQGRA